MPGLLRGGARGAVAPGTATTVTTRVRRRQAKGWAEQGDSYYPTSRTSPPPQAALLKDLAELKQQGLLTEEEFAAQKARTLAT